MLLTFDGLDMQKPSWTKFSKAIAATSNEKPIWM